MHIYKASVADEVLFWNRRQELVNYYLQSPKSKLCAWLGDPELHSAPHMGNIRRVVVVWFICICIYCEFLQIMYRFGTVNSTLQSQLGQKLKKKKNDKKKNSVSGTTTEIKMQKPILRDDISQELSYFSHFSNQLYKRLKLIWLLFVCYVHIHIHIYICNVCVCLLHLLLFYMLLWCLVRHGEL